MEKGLIHIYCGDGKGKTSAAIGLAVRAAGNGMKVLFTRFLKTEDSGELKILDQISRIEVIHLKKSFGFYKTLSEQGKKEMSGFCPSNLIHHFLTAFSIFQYLLSIS